MAIAMLAVQEQESKKEFGPRPRLTEHEIAILAEMLTDSEGDGEKVASWIESKGLARH